MKIGEMVPLVVVVSKCYSLLWLDSLCVIYECLSEAVSVVHMVRGQRL